MKYLVEQKTEFKNFVIQSTFAKDFLYGTLYKLKIDNKNGVFNVYIYHDHSTEEITILLYELNNEKDGCIYNGPTTCTSCISSY